MCGLKGLPSDLPKANVLQSSRKLYLIQHLFSQLIVFVCFLVSFQVSLPRLQVLEIQLTVSHKLSDFTESYPGFWECPPFLLYSFFFCLQITIFNETGNKERKNGSTALFISLVFFFFFFLPLNDVAVAINSLA